MSCDCPVINFWSLILSTAFNTIQEQRAAFTSCGWYQPVSSSSPTCSFQGTKHFSYFLLVSNIQQISGDLQMTRLHVAGSVAVCNHNRWVPTKPQISAMTWSLPERPSVMSFLCFVAPHRLAFLHEGADALLSVSQSQVVHHHLGGEGICCIAALSHLSLQEEGGRTQITMLHVFTPGILLFIIRLNTVQSFRIPTEGFMKHIDRKSFMWHSLESLKGAQVPVERGLSQSHDWSAGLTHPPGDGQRLLF